MESGNKTNAFMIQTFTDNWHQLGTLARFCKQFAKKTNRLDAGDTVTQRRRLALQTVRLQMR